MRGHTHAFDSVWKRQAGAIHCDYLVSRTVAGSVSKCSRDGGMASLSAELRLSHFFHFFQKKCVQNTAQTLRVHMRLAFKIVCMLACVTVALSQERFGRDEFSGELHGFSKSASEHIINRFPEVITVTTVDGAIRAATSDEPLPNALFEIRGPGDSERVVGTRTNREGSFRLKRIHPGEYVFKVTLDGFQSVVGRLRVVPDAKANGMRKIRITLNLGV